MKHTIVVAAVVLLLPSAILGQAVEPVLARVRQARAAFIETLRERVSEIGLSDEYGWLGDPRNTEPTTNRFS